MEYNQFPVQSYRGLPVGLKQTGRVTRHPRTPNVTFKSVSNHAFSPSDAFNACSPTPLTFTV